MNSTDDSTSKDTSNSGINSSPKSSAEENPLTATQFMSIPEGVEVRPSTDKEQELALFKAIPEFLKRYSTHMFPYDVEYGHSHLLAIALNNATILVIDDEGNIRKAIYETKEISTKELLEKVKAQFETIRLSAPEITEKDIKELKKSKKVKKWESTKWYAKFEKRRCR